MIDPAKREMQVVALLESWPWEFGGAVIGGYAVAAYGQPRYSHDLDVVIPMKSFEKYSNWLRDKSFDSTIYPDNLDQNYTGKITRWERDLVTLDLLLGGVMDRRAQVFVSESWLCRDLRELTFTLLDSRIERPTPVIRPEAFWALKLQAGRLKDLADLFSMLDTPTDLTEVRALYEQLWCDSMAAKLKIVLARLNEPKTYADTLSRLGRGSPDWKRNRLAWNRFRGMVRRCLPEGLRAGEGQRRLSVRRRSSGGRPRS